MSSEKKQLQQKDEEEQVGLKPTLNLMNGVTIIMGCIIGSGIFVSPKGVLIYTGSMGLYLIVWLLAGVFSTIGAYCFAELGTMIMKSGGDYAYLMEAFGPFLAFLRLWVECIIIRPCTTAVVALTFAMYALEPFFPECDPPRNAMILLAACCIGKY